MKEEAIKHIRSIHFSLLLVSTVLLLAMMSLHKGEIKTAILDAKGILNLQRLISEDPAILKRLAKKRFDEVKNLSPAVEPEGNQYYEVLFEVDEIPHKLAIKARYPELLIKDRKKYDSEKEQKTVYWNLDRGETVMISPPKNFGEFKKFWNFYNKERFLYYFPKERTFIDNGHFSISAYQFSSKKTDQEGHAPLHPFYDDPVKKRISFINFPKSVIKLPTLYESYSNLSNNDASFELLLRPLQEIDINQKHLTHEYHLIERTLFLILRKNDDWEVLEKLTEEELDRWKLALKKQNPLARPTNSEWVKASFQGQLEGDILIELVHRIEPIKINYQQYFSLVSGRDWTLGEFKNTFSEIENITGKNLDEIGIENLVNVLRSELKRSGDSIEIFGVKLPSETISTWGIIALVGLQLYFVLHFNMLSFSALNEEDKKYPWIGLFSDFTSRLTFIFTAAVLPLAVASYNIFVADGYFKYIAFAFIFTLTLVTVRSILSFQKCNFSEVGNTE